jgi:hypothetical protein
MIWLPLILFVVASMVAIGGPVKPTEGKDDAS